MKNETCMYYRYDVAMLRATDWCDFHYTLDFDFRGFGFTGIDMAIKLSENRKGLYYRLYKDIRSI